MFKYASNTIFLEDRLAQEIRNVQDSPGDSKKLRLVKSELRATQERYRRLVKGLGDHFVIFSHTADTNELLFVSEGCEKIFGIPVTRLINTNWADAILWAPGTVDRTYEELQKLLSGEEVFNRFEMRFIRPDGSEGVVLVSEYLSADENGREVVEGIVEDITEQIRDKAELKRLATRDHLTGLYNRNALMERLKEELRRAKRYQHTISLLLIDLDLFKKVNDASGHKEGDKVLICVASVFRSHSRATDFSVRFGGDEFVMILPETEEADALALAERVNKAIKDTCKNIDGIATNVSASIGIASYPKNGNTPDELIHAADTAMYKVKATGGNGVGSC